MLCPRCGVQLVDPGRADRVAPRWISATRMRLFRLPLAARLVLGVVLAVSLHLAIGHALAPFAGGEGEYDRTIGLVFDQLARVLAFGGAALLAGGGHAMGWLPGGLVGLIGGVIVAWVGPAALGVESAPSLGGPLEDVILGVVGGTIGKSVWKPFPPLDLPPPPPDPGKLTWLQRANISWPKVVLAGVAGVFGYIYAEAIRVWTLRVTVPDTSHLGILETRLIDWEMGSAVLFAAAIWSGAWTRIGVVRGFVTGLITAVGLGAYYAYRGSGSYPAFVVWFPLMEITRNVVPFDGRVFVLIVFFTLPTATLGGWLGTELFPPPRPARTKPRYLD